MTPSSFVECTRCPSMLLDVFSVYQCTRGALMHKRCFDAQDVAWWSWMSWMQGRFNSSLDVYRCTSCALRTAVVLYIVGCHVVWENEWTCTQSDSVWHCQLHCSTKHCFLSLAAEICSPRNIQPSLNNSHCNHTLDCLIKVVVNSKYRFLLSED